MEKETELEIEVNSFDFVTSKHEYKGRSAGEGSSESGEGGGEAGEGHSEGGMNG